MYERRVKLVKTPEHVAIAGEYGADECGCLRFRSQRGFSELKGNDIRRGFGRRLAGLRSSGSSPASLLPNAYNEARTDKRRAYETRLADV